MENAVLKRPSFDKNFLEKTALVMDINDFAQGLDFLRMRSRELEKKLFAKGFSGEITSHSVRKLKTDTFNQVGTLTLKGLIEIFHDLKAAGLPNHTSVKGYVISVAKKL